ncbi:OsmC family protein [Thiothrix eikelboomii]|uniref:Putative redox protein n=1 Tax=Thiothrix eikelboomii TaxID=92487 RepID=A0A1T4WAV8_9GAMM|nr:OsmC family protein [Thiothrix eikelboomii]SKA74422.1 putative redox protein [Thiothrix eikelboomii]
MNTKAKDPHTVTVNLRSSDGYVCDIKAGHHQLIADEPIPLGGTDLGPTPYVYLKAALGACTAMTIRMYAERKQWPLQDAVITLRHSRDGNKESVFERDIKLVGELDEEQRQRLLDIADRCPVLKTLSHGATILSKLID